jgi:hypothetical protein
MSSTEQDAHGAQGAHGAHGEPAAAAKPEREAWNERYAERMRRCGEGADAVWFAKQGWKVTAVDVSDVALGRAAGHAAEAGVAAPRRPGRRPRRVALIEGHSGPPAWEQAAVEQQEQQEQNRAQGNGHGGHAGMKFLKAAEILASLSLADGEWDVLVCEEHERIQNGPDGLPATRVDSTLKLRRR